MYVYVYVCIVHLSCRVCVFVSLGVCLCVLSVCVVSECVCVCVNVTCVCVKLCCNKGFGILVFMQILLKCSSYLTFGTHSSSE